MLWKALGKTSLLALLLTAFAAPGIAADLSGAGATFPTPVYSKWAETYKAETGNGLNYQSIGSGGGIKLIKAKTVTFGASDMPLKPEDLEASGLVQWPQIIGGVVPVIHLTGIRAGELTLNASILSALYLGEIKYWDDPEIAALNKGVKLPHTAVAPVYRADGSGTNFLFTYYLSAAIPKFASKIGANSSVEWPAGLGAKGNEGVAMTVQQTEGALGYVEFAYAQQNHLTFTKMQNKDGKFVEPSIASFQAAAAHADWEHATGFYQILANQPGAESWPITGASFIIMYKKPVDAAASAEAIKFFDWAFKNGAKQAEALAYVPLPANVTDLIRKTWSAEGLK